MSISESCVNFVQLCLERGVTQMSPKPPSLFMTDNIHATLLSGIRIGGGFTLSKPNFMATDFENAEKSKGWRSSPIISCSPRIIGQSPSQTNTAENITLRAVTMAKWSKTSRAVGRSNHVVKLKVNSKTLDLDLPTRPSLTIINLNIYNSNVSFNENSYDQKIVHTYMLTCFVGITWVKLKNRWEKKFCCSPVSILRFSFLLQA